MTALERAARAAWVERGHNPDEMLMGNPPRPAYTQLIPTVRAVLMAVRDSTDAMNLAAEEAELPGGQFGEPGFRESSIDELDAPVIWRAMIDAILNEKE